MAQVGTLVMDKLRSRLQSETGLAYALGTEGFQPDQVAALQAPAELMEKARGAKYPAFLVYTERVRNELREKFRTFSGSADAVIEVRVTDDRLEGISEALQRHVEAVTLILDGARGDWGDGVYFGGGYEIEYGAVRSGGRNFVQAAKVSCELKVSK